MEELIKAVVPKVTAKETEAMKAYFSFYKLNQEDLTKESEEALSDHPVFGPMLKMMSKAAREEQNRQSMAMQEAAIFHGEWEAYTRNLIGQGVMYAQLGFEFRSWYEVIKLIRDLLLPRLVEQYKGRGDEAMQVLEGMNRFFDIAMCIMGEAYLFEKKRIITEQKLDLEKQNKELEQFAYIASHDLQEPLRTINGFMEVFRKDYQGKLGDAGEQYINFMLEAVNRMRSLITGLLEYSRIGRSSRLTQVDLDGLLKHLLTDLDAVIQKNGATVKVNGPLPTVNGYEVELRMVFQNLISNAIKFRKPDVPPTVTISVQEKRTEWLFSVQDNGIGIDEKFYDTIFKLYQRLHSRDEYEGSGIGLTHSRKVIELHHGRIWVESKPNEGSTFYFTISKMLQHGK